MRFFIFILWLAGSAMAGGQRDVSHPHEIARRPFRNGVLRLVANSEGTGTLLYSDPSRPEQVIPCDVLTGAFGLWITDMEGDGSPEIIVTLRKSAKFDPGLHNRLHVYAIEDGQCVPVWRGTRLSGRFERITVDGARVVALERIGTGWRIARYRWHGFGYIVDAVLWQGRGRPGTRWMSRFNERK